MIRTKLSSNFVSLSSGKLRLDGCVVSIAQNTGKVFHALTATTSSSTWCLLTANNRCYSKIRSSRTLLERKKPFHHGPLHDTLQIRASVSNAHSKFAPTSSLKIVSRQRNIGIGMHNNLGRYSSPILCKVTAASYNVYPIILRHQIGSVSYFSSFFGRGGGKKPNLGGGIASSVGLVGAASVLFGKTKYLLVAAKATKLASLGSMALSVGAYSMFFGVPYAIGMVGLIFVHEMGHALAMHHYKIPFSPMVFLPFMGAVIAMKDRPRDAWQDALIAVAGPVSGSAGAAIIAVGAQMTDSQLLFALADFGFMINLFNLLPIGSMDGGRIAGALSKWVGVGGIGLGGLLAYQGLIHNPIFYLILLSGAYDTFQRFYDPHHLPPNYYRITNAQRAVLAGGYFGLIITLVAAMDANQKYRKPPEVLIREREFEERSWDFR
jgi:Zn-dependent protease